MPFLLCICVALKHVPSSLVNGLYMGMLHQFIPRYQIQKDFVKNMFNDNRVMTSFLWRANLQCIKTIHVEMPFLHVLNYVLSTQQTHYQSDTLIFLSYFRQFLVKIRGCARPRLKCFAHIRKKCVTNFLRANLFLSEIQEKHEFVRKITFRLDVWPKIISNRSITSID